MSNEDITQRLGLTNSEFYLTAPAPCPYLNGQFERKVFSYLSDKDSVSLNSELTQRGFRRSQNIIYLPACENCNACVPVRVIADEFEPTRSRRRIVKRNSDISRKICVPQAKSEQFSVLRGYLDARHRDGGMADMTVLDYASMVEESPVDTMLIEYYLTHEDGNQTLIACALSDRLTNGLSMVYSFFEPEEAHRSLGQYMILDHINLAKELGLRHVYLGYWVSGSKKMDYKQNFKPLEKLTREGWVRS